MSTYGWSACTSFKMRESAVVSLHARGVREAEAEAGGDVRVQRRVVRVDEHIEVPRVRIEEPLPPQLLHLELDGGQLLRAARLPTESPAA